MPPGLLCCFPFGGKKTSVKPFVKEAPTPQTNESAGAGVQVPPTKDPAARAALLPFFENHADLSQQKCLSALLTLANSRFAQQQLQQHSQPGLPKKAVVVDIAAALGFTSARIAFVASSLCAMIDGVLMHHVRPLLDSQKEEESSGSHLSLDSAEEIVVDRVAQTVSPQPSEDGIKQASRSELLCRAILPSLAVLRWLANSLKLSRGAPPASSFVLQSASLLINVLGPVLADPSAGMESVAVVEGRVTSLVRIVGHLGLIQKNLFRIGSSEEALAALARLPLFALDVTAKSTVALLACTLQGQTKAVLTPIRRANVLTDAERLLEAGHFLTTSALAHRSRTGAGPDPKAGDASFVKLFPYFKASSAAGGGVEAGEGHGPRKELFDLVARALTEEWGEPTSEPNMFLLLTRDSSTADIVRSDGSGGKAIVCPVDPSCRILLDDSEDITAASGAVDDHGNTLSNAFNVLAVGVDGVPGKIKISPPAAADTRIPLVYQRRSQPAFRRSGTHTWFNPGIHQLNVENASPGTMQHDATSETLPWLRMYSLAGWFAAQAVANGAAFPLELPTPFFKMLTAWPLFTPTVEDLEDLDQDDSGPSVAQVRGLSTKDLKSVLELEELPPTFTHDDYLGHLAKGILLDPIRAQMNAFHFGFYSTGIRANPIVAAASPAELATLVCGQTDDGIRDFVLKDEFRLIFPDEIRETALNRDVMLVALEAVFTSTDSLLQSADPTATLTGSMFRRKLLKFVTGRSRLPARSGEEPFRIEFPYSCMTSAECDEQLQRLPAAHTCSNTLELPNYAEAVLFGSKSPWYGLVGRKPGGMISLTDRKNALEAVTPAVLADVIREVEALLRNRLVLSVCNSTSYELDEMSPAISASAPATNWNPSSSVGPLNCSALPDDPGVMSNSMIIRSTTNRASLNPQLAALLAPSPTLSRSKAREGHADDDDDDDDVGIGDSDKEVSGKDGDVSLISSPSLLSPSTSPTPMKNLARSGSMIVIGPNPHQSFSRSVDRQRLDSTVNINDLNLVRNQSIRLNSTSGGAADSQLAVMPIFNTKAGTDLDALLNELARSETGEDVDV